MRYGGVLVPAMVAALAGCDDPTGPDGTRTETFEWSGQVAPAATIEIKNINGDVRARPGAGSTVRVHALKEGTDDDPSGVRIEVVESAQGVTVCALYPDVAGKPANECLPGLAGQNSARNNDVSVTFDIEVPAGRAFVGRSVAGSVQARDLSGFVNAVTVDGEIDVATSDLAEATTVNGDIDVSIGRVDWDRNLSFRAVAGDVTLRIPAFTNADVQGNTAHGSISTDFSLSITRFGYWQQLHGRLGIGGRFLIISTGSGDIRLLAKP